VLTRLKNPATRADIKSETVRIIREERGGGDPRNIVVAGCEWNAFPCREEPHEITQLRGMARRSRTPRRQESGSLNKGTARASSTRSMNRISKESSPHPATMIGSDGEIPTFGKAAAASTKLRDPSREVLAV